MKEESRSNKQCKKLNEWRNWKKATFNYSGRNNLLLIIASVKFLKTTTKKYDIFQKELLQNLLLIVGARRKFPFFCIVVTGLC